MNKYYKNLPKKRMGVGALIFNKKGELLIIKPYYKDNWSIPGGVVDKNESPKQACEREVFEEIGMKIKIKQLLCIDYISDTKEKDENLQFIFYGGKFNFNFVNKVKVNKNEISNFKFVDIKNLLDLGKKLQRRTPFCIKALKNNAVYYLENGKEK